jgi:hypothetical protein
VAAPDARDRSVEAADQSGSPGATNTSGTHNTAGGGSASNARSGTMRTRLATVSGPALAAAITGCSKGTPGRPCTTRPQSRPAAWNMSSRPKSTVGGDADAEGMSNPS